MILFLVKFDFDLFSKKLMLFLTGWLLQIILTMNDLMTRSFLIYVELKKQAMKDEESLPDLEIGTQLYAVDGQNLSQFFEEVAAIKIDMEDITNLYINIQGQNEDTKSAQSSKILGGIGDKIKSEMVNISLKNRQLYRPQNKILQRLFFKNNVFYSGCFFKITLTLNAN